MLETVTIEKLVHGGQGIATLESGKKVFVWNALPGEQVKIRVTKNKRGFSEAVAEEIIKPSSVRVEPRDDAYLSTSPWQIMTMDAENDAKRKILLETMQREKVNLPTDIAFHSAGSEWHYRSKMEYSFWADDDGLHLALYNRGTHGKRIVEGSSIARPEVDRTAGKIRDILNKAGIRGSQLKTVIIRCSQKGECVAALFVKDEAFPEITELDGVCKGLVVCYSNPKSPASILTKELYSYGILSLTDQLLGKPISYNVHSFFQVNLPVFESALNRIKAAQANQPVIDFYSGVGAIGVAVGASSFIESDAENIKMAELNVQSKQKIIHAAAETATDYITAGSTLIVDPPRAGLHPRVIDKILETRPAIIIYLSCNPITQARDVALLQNAYELKSLEGYNFFPKTPHIESLAILRKIDS